MDFNWIHINLEKQKKTRTRIGFRFKAVLLGFAFRERPLFLWLEIRKFSSTL
jgi:hypothetical protein